ncbi:hypothetical protein T09_10023 [Trichinella sp. T9]|nr:hypothetical protein T09_10023 [Trichinella sp. T9]
MKIKFHFFTVSQFVRKLPTLFGGDWITSSGPTNGDHRGGSANSPISYSCSRAANVAISVTICCRCSKPNWNCLLSKSNNLSLRWQAVSSEWESCGSGADACMSANCAIGKGTLEEATGLKIEQRQHR